MKRFIGWVALCFVLQSGAQEPSKKVLNWYNGKKLGMSTDKAYAKLLSGKKSTPVVVAVIDSGVDIKHEDLKGRIWINTDEIAGNGIDDDDNGYIDDVNGWNFLGSAEGENINDVRLEVTRLYAQMKETYEGKSYGDLSAEEKPGFALYKELKETIESEQKNSREELDGLAETIKVLKEANVALEKHFGTANYTKKQLKKIKKDEDLGDYAQVMLNLFDFGMTYSEFDESLDYYRDNIEFNYNPDVDERARVIGDDITDINDRNYGNNDVEGPDASHGTHCAGIIGALRNNNVGNDGVADNVRIMSIRAVPNGDEWDKDIALAIRYAVDNGAQIINMSFGKAYSPQQQMVMEAFKYAEEKGVLLVHAAGNEGADNDTEENYPRPKYAGMSQKFSNWIEVGASTRYKKGKVKYGMVWRDGIAADFSNYGDEMVDVYAPGHDIYSTIPNNEYAVFNGTSMAGPMVAGAAALLKSYFPDLSMLEIREIILKSVQHTEDRLMPQPGNPINEVKLDNLCVTGGIVNVYGAVEMAITKTTLN